MPKRDMSSLIGREVAAVPAAETEAPVASPQPAAPSATATARKRVTERREAAEVVEEEALGVDVPVSLKRELKSTAGIRGEKMKHIVARAIRRELDRMNQD